MKRKTHGAGIEILPAEGKLGVLCVGLGAVATTLIAGVELIKQNQGIPAGSLTQMGRIRLGKRTDGREPLIRKFLPLASLDDLVFGAWDIYSDDGYTAAIKAKVLQREQIDQVSEQLASIKPMTAVFDPNFVRGLQPGDNLKTGTSKMDLATQVMMNIREFRERYNCDRLIMLNVSSTEADQDLADVHMNLSAFEDGLDSSDPRISPAMIYAYAALISGVPVINGTPSMIDIPALEQLAKTLEEPVCGKDFKTGQTLIKAAIAGTIKSRYLGLDGWYSDNILGNRDGEALNDPQSFKSKQKTKAGVLEGILEPEKYPELYEGADHQVHIHYYKPKGDNKMGMDTVNFRGFLGYEMQLIMNIQCRDSILAAPLCIDLILLMDLAKRAGMKGVQEFLSFYFKAPQALPGVPVIHHLGEQEAKLLNWMRWIMGEELITFWGMDYEVEEESSESSH